MAKSPEWLLDFKRDVHSQTGEDGIIAKILEILPENDQWCVEFGAWDGVYCSNVRSLVEQAGYSAVLIEGDKKRFGQLCENYAEYDRAVPINRSVGFSDTDNLDELLQNIPIPRDFDFLSIDVDGNDYHIWKAVSRYIPKVVCIEFNPTIPTEVDFVQPADASVNQGASLLALTELAKEKGYELVSVLTFNALFVRAEFFPLFEIQDNSPATLRKDLSVITYLFSGYDGQVFLHGHQVLPWHQIKIQQSKVQQLPKTLRKYPQHYTEEEQRLFTLHRKHQDLVSGQEE